MPTYKCKRCKNELTLSIKPGQCEICGASQFKIVNQRQSKFVSSDSSEIISGTSQSNFSTSKTTPPTFGQSSYQSFLSAYKLSLPSQSKNQYSSPELPLYSDLSNIKTSPHALSARKKNKLFFPKWLALVIIFFLTLVGYWQWKSQFDTSDFNQVILQESFKNPKFWSLTKGATIKNGGLYQKQSLLNHYGTSIWMKKNFQEVDFAADVIKATGPDDIPFGLVTKIHGKNYQNFYYLLIDGKGDFVMGKHSPEGWTHKVGWKKNGAIKKGNQKNHLRIVCKDNLIMGFINGKLVGSFRDESYLEGKIAVFSMRGRGQEMGIYFDNILLQQRSMLPIPNQPAQIK